MPSEIIYGLIFLGMCFAFVLALTYMLPRMLK